MIKGKSCFAASLLAVTAALATTSCAIGEPPHATAAPSLFLVERVAAMPSSYRAYLGENMYYIEPTPPFQVVKSSLTGSFASTLATTGCASRPAITAVFEGYLLLACNGSAVKRLILLSVDNGRTTTIFQRQMTAPVMAFANWTGQYLEWYAEKWTEPGGPVAWGVTDAYGRSVPVTVRRELGLAAAYPTLNDLQGHLFILRGPALEEWNGTRFARVGDVGTQRLVAAGDGRVVVESINSNPNGSIRSITYRLESLSPPHNIVSWQVSGSTIAGMVYSITYSRYSVDLYFPLLRKHYLLRNVTGEPDVSNGQVYFPSPQGYQRLTVLGRETNTMTQALGAGGFWP